MGKGADAAVDCDDSYLNVCVGLDCRSVAHWFSERIDNIFLSTGSHQDLSSDRDIQSLTSVA